MKVTALFKNTEVPPNNAEIPIEWDKCRPAVEREVRLVGLRNSGKSKPTPLRKAVPVAADGTVSSLVTEDNEEVLRPLPEIGAAGFGSASGAPVPGPTVAEVAPDLVQEGNGIAVGDDLFADVDGELSPPTAPATEYTVPSGGAAGRPWEEIL
jgi:hypothetical protein